MRNNQSSKPTFIFFFGILLMLFTHMTPAQSRQDHQHETPTQQKHQLPKGFVYLHDIAPDIEQDLRYATSNNFTGKIVPGYESGNCIMRIKAAHALARVQQELSKKGLGLRIYDCYRPVRAVRAFGKWAKKPSSAEIKQKYFPRLTKRQLFSKGYIATRSSHSKGNTVDLTLVHLNKELRGNFLQSAASKHAKILPQQAQKDDDSLEMGTAFDCFDALTHTHHPMITGQARYNRRLLLSIMQKHGFRNFRMEWWHFTFQDRATSKKHYDFSIKAPLLHNQ